MRAILLLSAAVWLFACELPPAAPPQPPVPVVAAAAAQPFGPAPWGSFRSERFGLRVPLPDGHAWRIDDHGGPWLSAAHAASSSELLVKTWIVDGRASRRRCEEEARLRRKLPEREGADIVEQHPVKAPAELDTFVEVGVVPAKPGAPIQAFAFAFGGHAHRCFAYVFTTSASGPGAEKLVGERLATMVERSLGEVAIDSELSPRVPREAEPVR